MSYAKLPSQFPGMYFQDESGKWHPRLASGKKHPLCQVARCTRVSEKGSPGNGRSLQCNACRVRLWRANNPIQANYNAIKNKARRRKIEFTLTITHFTEICEATGFHLTRGRGAHQFHLDRIDNSKGYVDGNVRVITARENVQKRHTEPAYRTKDEWEGGDGYEQVTEEPEYETVYEPPDTEPF